MDGVPTDFNGTILQRIDDTHAMVKFAGEAGAQCIPYRAMKAPHTGTGTRAN